MSDLHNELQKLKETMNDSFSTKDVVEHTQKVKGISAPFSKKDMALIFLDVEATGCDGENDKMIQLAFLKQKDDKVECYNDLCFTDGKMSYTAMGIHHITPEMVVDACLAIETESYKALEKENSELNYFITHNNSLDVAMLENEGMVLKMKRIDTDVCARHLLKDAENYKLQTLRYQYGLYRKEEEAARKFGVDTIRAHDALSDALLHHLLFELLLEKVNGDVDALVALTDTPVILEKITFGKYKDQDITFEELFQTDPMDFVWMYTHLATKWKDLESTVEYWLQKDPYYWNIAQEKRKKMAWFD
jgi:DNA polymerase III epsilon subunit-like protein